MLHPGRKISATGRKPQAGNFFQDQFGKTQRLKVRENSLRARVFLVAVVPPFVTPLPVLDFPEQRKIQQAVAAQSFRPPDSAAFGQKNARKLKKQAHRVSKGLRSRRRWFTYELSHKVPTVFDEWR
jgi:hypothetical protein